MRDRLSPATTTTIVFCAVLLLCGCYQELYTNLPERQINEMMAILLQAGIPCEKTAGVEGSWSLRADSGKIPLAMRLLGENGYPREAFESMGRVFEKKGLISSPTEERIRFIYALSQEIAETLARIDGVLDARVHIVLPENDPYADKLIPSSAAVFIKQKPGVNLEAQTIKIKELVVNAIEGLEFKNVTLAWFQASAGANTDGQNTYVNLLGFKLAPQSAGRLQWLLAVLVFLSGSGLVAVCVVLFRSKFRWSDLKMVADRIRQKSIEARSRANERENE